MFFVSGITGQVGGAAARQLLGEGHTVRTLARDPLKAAEWSQKGVDVRRGDFNDAADVAGALEGVEGAYLMLPPVSAPAPGFPEAKAVIASFREALRQAPPPRLVVLSSVGSQRSSGLGNITSTHLLEEALDNLPFPTAFIRAGSFLENYTFGLETAASTGWFDSYLTPTDRAVPMVATADIGKEIARLLAEVSFGSGALIVILGTAGVMLSLSLFVGSLVGLQGFRALDSLGVDALTGFITAYFNTRDIAPLVASAALTATLGAGFTAQLGAMRISEEIDALEVMAVPSVPFLITTP